MATKKCYLVSANTSAGFVSFFGYVLKDAERAYIIKGGPGCGKSTFIRKAGEELLDSGFDVDFIYCSADKDSLDGIFVHDVNMAIVDGTAPHVIEPKYPGAVERILYFGDFWDIDYLRSHKDKIRYFIDEIGYEYNKYFNYMKNAKLIHDKLEAEYTKGMDFDRADILTEQMIKETIIGKKNKMGSEVHRFAGALTPQGQVSFYNQLTVGIKNRYILKGRPGTGKSTMEKKIAKAALEAGYDVEYYHCAFDPDSIDMIIIPELSFAMLDGTAPHVFDPEEGDKLVDMFRFVNTKIVREEEDPIKSIAEEYREEINKAKKVYERIKRLHDELEKYYVDATDFNEVDALRRRIVNYIKAMKEQ
ncbi:PRK06851 family protein [Fonticella tunisiensis]|uniref:ATPase n=1 Tax=Fonticella tunisiensis TaxID=1096341 RepID=A0A4R7KU89_9CLOT|nr:PRK06851 family protein [Fonticella tunisiensis]TDT63718.1 hypothetical protein EDD71_101145 [Fonticella tunisiensis]